MNHAMWFQARNEMKRYFIAVTGMLVLLASAQIYASVFGTVKAIVHDPQHRPVQGAQVIVQSKNSAVKLTGQTNEEGLATVMNVPVGEYQVTINAAGFSGK